MALIGNYFLINKSPGKFRAGTSGSNVRSNDNINSDNRNFISQNSKLTAIPSGYLFPYTWAPPQADGGMASTQQSLLAISPAVNLAGGINPLASSSIALSLLNAQLDQIVTFMASANLIMAKQTAEMSAAVNAIGSSLLTLSSYAELWAMVDAGANSAISLTGSVFLSALGNMNAEAGGPTPLSPEGLAQAVWQSLLSDYTIDGTMGKSLADALASVGGGDPVAIADEIMTRGLLKLGDFIALK